jgi:dUTP pyrophosphatase
MFCVKKLTPNAILPCRSHPDDAGMDLVYSRSENVVIPPMGRCVVPTDISIQLVNTPDRGYYIRVAPRSGLAAKFGIDVGAGVVDISYTGHIQVVMFNHSDTPYTISQGDKIAQLIVEKIIYPTCVEVTSFEETERGENGFGSTDNKQG